MKFVKIFHKKSKESNFRVGIFYRFNSSVGVTAGTFAFT